MNCYVHSRPAVGMCAMCGRGTCRDCVAADSPHLICRNCAARPAIQGFEYRSALEIAGLPLIHICAGVHPVTKRPRVARGVIAIGNVALGGVAIGGTLRRTDHVGRNVGRSRRRDRGSGGGVRTVPGRVRLGLGGDWRIRRRLRPRHRRRRLRTARDQRHTLRSGDHCTGRALARPDECSATLPLTTRGGTGRLGPHRPREHSSAAART